MKKANYLFLNADSYQSFSFFSLLLGILLVALPASLSAQVTFTALDDLSVNAGIQTGVSGGTPTGGVYTGPGVIDDGNGMTYSFDPAAAGVGIHTLTYTVGMNSASDDVEVLNLTPPTFSKSFDITEIGPGSVSTLTFTIDNSGSDVGVTDLDFTDNLPAGMTIATPANVTNSCGLGTVTAPDGGTTISFTDGTLGAGSSCTISVDVTSSTPGTSTNTTGDLNSSSGNSGTATADLTVATNRPGFSKSFSPGSVNFGERSTLTFTIDNSANSGDMWSLNFTDNLPAGMEVASPPNIVIGCTGGTLTAEPGSTVISYDYPVTIPALAAGSTCTISVDVVGTNASTLINVTDNLTGLNSMFTTVSSGKASAALEVLTPTEIFLQKSFNPNPAAPGGTTNLEFTISNFDRDFAATNVTFTDDLSTVLAGLTAIGTPINDVCGTGSQISGTTNLTFTGGTIPPEGSCTFSVPLSVPAGAAGGIYTNTTGAITGDLDGTTITGNMANENLTIAYVPTITKDFLIDPIVAGGLTTLEFTITNTDPSNPATDISFSDDFSAFLSGASITSLPAPGSCGASSSFSYDSFTGLFQMNGGEIAAGGSCTFSIDITIPTSTASGIYNNTTSSLSSTIDGDIVLGNPASDDLEVLAIPQLSKSFTDDPVNEGEIVNLEFEITYDDFATVDANSISFTDDLNAVISGLSAIGLPINDVCGVGSQLSGTTNLSFTGGTMSPGDVCTFSVPVQVPAGTLPGTYPNTTSTLSSTVDGQTGTSDAATDDLLIGGLTLTKEFIDDPTIPGDLVILRFTIDNTTTEDATSIFFSDNLGTVLPGLEAEAPLPNMPCGGTSMLFGTDFLIFFNGEVSAGTSCSFDVNVRVPAGADPGTYTNTTSNLTATFNGMSVTLPPATDELEVNDNFIALSKTFTDDPVLPGGTVTVEYTLTNLDPLNAVSNIAFTDDFDALLTGLQATGLPMAVCGGTVSGTGLLSFTGGSLAAGASCTFSVTLQTPIDAPYGGSLPCPTSGVTGEINGFPVVGDPASDNLDFQLLQFSKSFAGDVEPGGSTTLTFTITNPDPDNSVNVIRFTDDLDAVLSGMVATNLPLNDICGPGSSVTGTSTIVFDNGVLDPGQSCTFDVIVEIPCGSPDGSYLNTTSEINADGIDGDPATAFLTVSQITVVSFTAPADLCVDAGVQAGLGGGTPTGGVYSGPGVTDDGNGETYSFDPAAAGAGVHTLTYTFTDGNGCTYSATDDVEVFELPMVTLMSPGDVCITDGVMTFNGGSPTGGVYSGPGVMDNSNGIDYDFDPMAAGLGMHTITYDYTDPNGCSGSATAIINVDEPFPVSLTIPPAQDTLCVDAGIQMISNAGSPTGGVYSGSGVTDGGDGISFTFDPAGAGPGLQLITYTVSGMGGCDGMFTDFIHVFDLPVVTFSIPAEQDTFCVDAAVEVIAGGAPPGGVYSGPGVTDDGNGTSFTFDPAAAGAGFHIITYLYTDDIGCSNSFDDFIHVLGLPAVAFTAPADLCIDAGVQAGLAGGSPTGGVYSGPGVTDDGNGETYSFDPAAAGAGVHTLTYTYTDANGCTDSASDDVEVFALPVVTFTALADLCIDAGVQAGQGGGTPTGGVYSGDGVTDDGNGETYSFDPAAAGVGVHTITYTFTDANGCTNSASDDVEVFALPMVSFTAPDDLCIDAGVQAGQGGGTPTGGVYSGPGVTDDGNGETYSFDPAAAGVGVHTITYTYTDANGCTDSASDDVEVFALPVVTFTALADLCIDAGVQAGLAGGSPTGGVYSGPGVTDDGNGETYSFDPAAAGAGVHTLTYTYTDANGCTDSASDDVEVFALPVVTFTALADLCIDAGVQAGQGGGTPTGGVYSGDGVTDDGNGETYSFDPAAAGVGVHTITYTFTDANGCTNSASDEVEVFALPMVSFTAPDDLCIDAGVQAGQGGGTPTGGVYSGPGVTDDGNGETYSFDPAAAGVGVHTITYTYTDANGCTDSASDDVEVFALPVVTFTALADLCIDAGVQAGLAGGSPTGGVYSGPGVTDDGNGETYSFDPAAAGVGVHTITYTYTDANGCTDSASDDVEVFALPVVTFTALADLCVDAGVQAGQGGGTPTGGVYSGDGVTDDGNGETYSFDPAAAGVGVHTITYTFTDANGCTNSASDEVEVFALPMVSFTAPDDLCIDAGVQAGQGGGTPTGGVYSGPGVTDDGNGETYSFDPAAAGVGVHTITYTYTDANGCTDSASDDVEVFALPVVTFTALADLCIDAGEQAGLGGGTPTGGVYSGPGVTDEGNGETYSFDPAAAGVGVHTLTYTYTDGNGCTDSASDEVEVFALPVVEFTAPMDMCVDAGEQAGLGGGTPTGGVYSGPGVTDEGNGETYSFDPAAAGVGVHTITYDYTDANGCSGSASDEVEVFDLPSVSFMAGEDLCINAGVQTGQGSGVPQGGVYSGPGVTDDGNGMTYSFDPAAAGVGVHTITYTYDDTNGCTGTFSDDIEVFDIPMVSYTAPADLCIDAGVQAGLGGGTPTGGVYSGPGVTDDGNGMTYSFDPAAAGVGVHTLTYTFTDSNGCTNSASDDVEVFALPVVEFTAPDDLCIDAGVQAGLGGGTPTGGVYSGPGVTDDGNGETYSFDPAAAGVGVHTITYDYTDANGCSGSASDDVEVFDTPVVELVTEPYHCLDAEIQDLPMTGGVPTGGVYSGTGITDNGNGISYFIDPTVNGVGTVTVTYTFTDENGCTNSAMSDIEIIDCDITNSFEVDDPCQCLDNATIFNCNDETGGDDGQFSELVTVSAAGGPLPNGMTWTVVGATGAFDEFNVPPYGMQSAGVPTPGDGSVLLAFNNGVYELPFVHVDDIGYTLMIEGPFAMGSAANITFTISNKCQYPDPVFDPVVPFVIKTTDPVITLGGTDTNGGSADTVTFTINGNPETELDPAALGVGFHTVNMIYDGEEDGNGGLSPDGGATSASPGCIQEVTKEIEIVDCDLVVDCSNVTDSTLACIADLPPADLTLPIIVDSCGAVTVTEETIVPPNTGCPNDTLIVTRSYFIEDETGLMDTCMQTFTVISTMDPTFTSFPGDTTVLCGASTDPAATGMAEGEGECHPADPQATVTFNDVITPGGCPAEMTITRTWTVTDRCGRSVDMDQTIMVVDTIAPTMVCQNITVELDENGMATADPNDVDNGSSDNCGGPVTLSLSMDMFTCDNTGPNDVWLIGEDECGNRDSCMAVITVEDNIDPTITCPADIEMPNDLGVCGAIVEYEVVADDNCGFNVMQTEGIPSGGFFPVGETTNCFTVTDDSGATAECCFTVTINDEEGPMIDCPSDIGVQLEPGECEEIVFFDVPFMDNCGSIDAEMSQAVNEALVSTALDCANNTSNHLRYFENTLLVPVDITQVNFGIFNSGVNETVTVNVYMIGPGAPFIYANMVLMGTADYMVPAGMNQVIVSAPVEATIPVGMNYVLELKANNTTNFVIGYNTAGETGSTYISGNPPVPCASLEPLDIDAIGFGAFAVVLYSNAEGGPFIEQTGGLPSGSYYPIGTTTNTFKATDVYGNMTFCEFDVNVVEFENGVTGVMACNDNVNISLDLDCQLELNADMLLEGDVYGCYDDYIIEVSGGVVGTTITEPGTYTVTITDPDTGNSCWSTINVESKAVPIIDCANALCPIDMLEGEWTEDDDTFSPGAAWAFDGFPPNNNILYDVIQFVVEVPGIYNLVMTPSDEFDGIAGIYADSFDPDNPADNLIGGDDDLPGIFESEPSIMIMLEAGTYFLVSSTWGAGQMGAYTWTFSGPGDLLSDCVVKCYELDALLSGDLDIPDPTVTSCIPFELFYSDAVDYNDCGTTTVTRTYVAENANGVGTCEVTFEIDPASIALDIRLPEPLVELTCNDGTDPEDIVAIFDNPLTTDNPNTDIVENNEGYIFAYPTYEVNGHPQKVDNNVCNIYAAYTDQELSACAEGCNGNRKVIRTWTLVDWCTLDVTNFVQTIKAVDTEAPTLITQDVTVSTDAWGCEASFEAPLPWELHDNCDSNPEYNVSGPAGVSIQGSFEEGYFISGAPKGTHTFNYIAYDCCGNEASYPFTVTVLDITPPVVIAKQNVVVSLTSGSSNGAGLAKLYAESIDNGSYDGCSNTVKLEIRRDADNCDVSGNATYNADGHPQDGSSNPNSPSYDPDGGAYVKFCCEDLTNATVDVNGDGELDAGYVKVWLRVWDDGDMDGDFGTSGDNYNEAWAFVKVEDKLAPAIQCPPDVTLTCDMDYTDLGMTGSASAFGSCGGVDVEYNDIIISLNTCNEGFVRRRWSVVGRSDIFCDQTITLEDLDQPVNVSFSQVQDFTAANCPDMIALGEPTWTAGPCDVIGYSMETDTFLFEDGACYKLVNHWTVINWCDYEPNNPQWNGEGLWEHVQVIKVTDETQPVIEDCEDKMYAINDHSDSDDDGEVCEAKIVLTNVATDPGSDNCPTGWLKWQVFVDLWGDGTNDLEYSSFLPPFDTQFNDTNGNGIPDVYVSPTANGETVSIPLPDIAGSMSNHKVSWKVTDGCNNVTSCDTEFMVVDKKAPTPYCVNLSTAVMESSGTVELWAIDFNVGSFDNCTAQEDLRYTFSDVAPEDDPNYEESQKSSSMVFDCGDVEGSPAQVSMYVWDEKGNADFCIVFLTIVDNTGACGGKPDIAGKVATEAGLGVEEVEVTLEADLPEYPRTEMTDEEGSYIFFENALNASYELTGSKDVDYMNGVSTLDLVKIQRHILGLEMLNSPYKLIAADVNADDEVKASDLLELRKLILGVIVDLPTNDSWRFVDSEQSMAMDMDLADVDYTQEVDNLQGNTMSKNFVAVKVGDVTEDATANLTNVTTVVRSGKTLELSIENQAVESGQTVSVGFTSEDFQNVFGYQFTMELNGLEFVGVTPGAVGMKEENVGVLSTNMVTMSYNSSTSVSAGNNEELFTVQFLATKTGDIANMIDITSKVTRSEAYTSESLDISTVALTTRGEITEYAATELYQNEPNPFVEQTVIGFNLAETAKATMTVFDVTGKVILKKAIDGVKGYNTLNLTAKQLGTSGVLYYTLESGEYTATKKMIVIE